MIELILLVFRALQFLFAVIVLGLAAHRMFLVILPLPET